MHMHRLLWCVRIGSGFGLQAFLRDLLIPRALFSHFRSELCPLKSGPSRRGSSTPQYSPLSLVNRLESPPSLSMMIPLTQGLERERALKSWELIPSSEGWMCNGDEVEDKNDEDPSEEEMPVVPHAMDMDADKDYLQYLEELRRHPEYSPVRNSQAFAQNPTDDAQSPPSDARSQPSFDLSGVWLPPIAPSQ
ncbi:hypothetical protein PIB30_083650 [Stylosanthes scabra]|uniref:Uncharacterized protein n=1 Tax=Stylosanthes scabra TaxID=79078 RepID=A0ABU6TT37_9FABA|nr:hypothetical protein [Stylosanthes scabra]